MNAVNDPKGEAGAKKAPMWLLPPVALEQTAWVHKLGNDKYGPFNWRKTGVCATTYVSAIMRHLNAWRDGEDKDPESGISHIAHIATSCNILLDAAACGTLQDDRNKRPGAGIHGLGVRVYPDVECHVRDVTDRSTASRMPEILAEFGADFRDDVQEEWLNRSPWVDLTKREPFEATPCEVPAPVTQLAQFDGHIVLDGELVKLPPVPEGYDRWVVRGRGWNPGAQVMYTVYNEGPGGFWSNPALDTPLGLEVHYIEAIKDDDCQKATVEPLPREALFGRIKPGDYVEGRLVRGQEFDGYVTNIVDIRGTKVFQFSDRSPLTEDEIYSITRA